MPVRTFLDSNVLIAAFRGDHAANQAATDVIDDPNREFVISDLVRLETLPKALFHKNAAEIEFLEAVFGTVVEEALTTPEIVAKAIELAAVYNLNAFDACLATTAVSLQADEFISCEKPTKPFFSIVATTKFLSIYSTD